MHHFIKTYNYLKTEYHKHSSQFITIGAHKLHYLEWGSGTQLLIAFHGYGNDALIFSFLQHPNYRILSFDMPFHGQSVSTQDVLLTREELKNLSLQMMEKHGASQINLVGFSMGARLCMCIAEMLPEQTSKLMLVAADGLQRDYVYDFLTKTIIGKSLFKGFISRANFYLKMLSLFRKLGFLNEINYRFIHQYIATQGDRQKLYDVWLCMRSLVPNRKLLIANAVKNNFEIEIFAGKQDPIIPLSNAFKFAKAEKNIKVNIFERGHNLLVYPEVKNKLASALFSTPQNAQLK